MCPIFESTLPRVHSECRVERSTILYYHRILYIYIYIYIYSILGILYTVYIK